MTCRKCFVYRTLFIGIIYPEFIGNSTIHTFVMHVDECVQIFGET